MRKRMLSVLTVALMVVVMLGAMASPAFALGQKKGQTDLNLGETQNNFNTGNSCCNTSTNDGGDKGNTTNTGSKFQGGSRFGDQNN